MTAFVVPGDVDDPAAVSGGNVYDRRIARTLGLRMVALPGAWPRPGADARRALGAVLDGVADGAAVLLDGLVACGVPDIVRAHAGRLRLAVLVHLPLAQETGLSAAEAAALDAREREVLRACAAAVATAPWTARRLVDHHGVAPRRVHLVPPGTEPAPLAPGTDGVSALLCVAAVVPRKGQDLLVEALARLGEPRFGCAFVGPEGRDPDFAARLRRLIDARGLGGRVRLCGPRAGARLAADYAAADLVVLPSRADTFGMVLTEALARGIPVLAAERGGIPETVGEAGLLVAPEDPAALAEALRRWRDDPGLRGRLREAARRRRESLQGWDAAAARMAAVLAGLG